MTSWWIRSRCAACSGLPVVCKLQARCDQMCAYPLVSIIVPCYNAGRFVEATLQSALAQTWVNTEIIVVDDGSSDGSRERVERYVSPRVRLMRNSGNGAASARNRGLSEANGDYIQYLDADDLLSPDKLTAQVNLLEQSPPGCVAFSATTYFHDGNDPAEGIRQDAWPLVDTDDPLDWLIELLGPDGHGSMVHPASWLTPRSVAEKAGPWDERLSLDDDGEYFCRVVLASRGLRRSLTGRSYYRKHPSSANNLSAQKFAVHQRSALLALDLKREKILSLTDSSKAKRALARSYDDAAFIAYPFNPKVSDLLTQRSRELRIESPASRFETVLGKTTEKLFGWKVARRMQILYQRFRRRSKVS